MSKAMARRSDAQTIPLSFTLNGRLQELEVEPHELCSMWSAIGSV